MNVFAVVNIRNRDVRRGLLAFAAGIAVFVLTVDLVSAVWLGSTPFLSWSNLEFVAWLAGIIVVVSTVQFLRFARDGRRVSGSLGGQALADYAAISVLLSCLRRLSRTRSQVGFFWACINTSPARCTNLDSVLSPFRPVK